MSLYLADWRIDVLLVLSVVGVLVSIWLTRAAQRLRHETPHGMLSRLERLSFTMTDRGDIFRLVSQLGWLGFLLTVVLFEHPGVNALIPCWIVGQLTIPLHSLFLLRATQKSLTTIPGSPVYQERAHTEQPKSPKEE